MAGLKSSVGCRLFVCFLLAVMSSASFPGEAPPHVESPISHAPVIVDINQRLGYTLTCKASGNPAPSYQWKRNGNILNDRDKYIKAFANGTLYFKNFTDKENGIYQCLASNSLGTSVSDNVPLWNIKPAEKSTFAESESESQRVQAGEPATLRCGQTPDTVPKWNRRWYFTHGSTEVQTDKRIGTDSEGNLRFAYTKSTDIKSYTCGLVPPVLKPRQDIVMYKTVLLIVTPSDTAHTRPLQIEHHSGNNTKGILNQNITLECFFSGNPLPNITWRRDSRQLTDLDNGKIAISDYGRRLKISKLEDTDQGEYVCEGSNGFHTQQHIIFLNVTSAPMKLPHKGLINKVATDRKNIVLRCVARASHNESLNIPVWYRNGRPLNTDTLPDPARYSFNGDHTELHITQPDKAADTASFQCNVSNSEGYTFYDAYLTVIESIKITKRPEAVIEIYRHEAIDISVQATGDNCCKLSETWSLNGVHLSQDDLETPPFRKDNSGSLWFDPRNVSEETLAARTGLYHIRVSSVYDSREVKFNISLKDGAPVTEASVAAASGGFELWWALLVCGLMLIIVAVTIIIVFVKRNYPGESYPLEKTEIRHHLNPKEDLLNNSFQTI
ncbi:hypothetical protein BsWGS_24151 [Bradybaena similaris]